MYSLHALCILLLSLVSQVFPLMLHCTCSLLYTCMYMYMYVHEATHSTTGIIYMSMYMYMNAKPNGVYTCTCTFCKCIHVQSRVSFRGQMPAVVSLLHYYFAIMMYMYTVYTCTVYIHVCIRTCTVYNVHVHIHVHVVVATLNGCCNYYVGSIVISVL